MGTRLPSSKRPFGGIGDEKPAAHLLGLLEGANDDPVRER
jgi:hypothetical protein